MKMMTIRPVAEPKSFADVKFTQAEYKEAVKAGPKSVPSLTAFEALRNSRGLYEIVPEAKQEVEVKVGGLSPEDMDNQQLKMLALQMGVTLRKKSIRRVDLIALVKGKMDAIEIVDDDVEGQDEEEEETSSE